MQIDNIRVSRKLWGAFILLMLAMLLISGFQQYRANSSMSAAMDQVVEIEERISAAIRWRGATETAVNMVMGGAVTTDAVLAQQYDAKVKEIIGGINKIQEGIVAGATAPEKDLLRLRIKGNPMHVGIVTAPGDFLHVRAGNDSVVDRYRSRL